MKKYTSLFGVMMVLIFAACSIGSLSDVWKGNSTTLTGQVIQLDAETVTLRLGELAVVQTSESAAMESLLATNFIQAGRSSSHTVPAIQTPMQVFVPWQKDVVLNLGTAKCFVMADDGAVQTASLESITPKAILNVTVSGDRTPLTVVVLKDIRQGKADAATLQGTSAASIEESTTRQGEEYTSESADENALRIIAAKVGLRSVRVEKSDGGSTSTAASNYYGRNAALLVTGGAQVTLSKGVVNSSASDSCGVFGHGSGTSLRLNDTTITTTGERGTGLQTSGGACANASNMTITTSGTSAPVLRTESGSLNVEGGTYTSGGYDAPVIDAAGEVVVQNAELTANNSEAIVVSDAGSLSLENCDVSGNRNSMEEEKEPYTVKIGGQSSPAPKSISFAMSDGSLISRNGDVFYIEGADCELELNRIDLLNMGGGALLRVASKGERQETAVHLKAKQQTLSGNLMVDSDSTLQLELTGTSLLSGAIVRSDDEAGNGYISVKIDQSSTWVLTGDSTVDSLDNKGTIQYNGHCITLADGTVLRA